MRAENKLEQASGVRLPRRRNSQTCLEWMAEAVLALLEKTGDALSLYTPLPGAVAFHASSKPRRLVVGGNQSGKSLACAVECARLARGLDPYRKRPAKDLRIQVVAYDEPAIADIIWTKLGCPGAFWMLADEETGLWRAVRVSRDDPRLVDPADEERRHEWVPAPPLIPPQEIAAIVWSRRGRGVPSMVELVNGTRLNFYSSHSLPRQGVELDYVWFDEEIENVRWLPESTARLVRRNGLFTWSATPQHGTDQLLELHKLAQEGSDDIDEFVLCTDHNPHLSVEGRRRLYERLSRMGDEELRVRWYGEYAAEGRRVYGSLRDFLVDSVPVADDWMRILVLDPGHQASAVLFMAVPPDGSAMYCYDEIYLKQASADVLAEHVAKRLATWNTLPEAFLIDGYGGRHTVIGSAENVSELYSAAFAKHEVESADTGSGFEPVRVEVAYRTELVKTMLGEGRLKIARDCRTLIYQLENKRYHKHRQDRYDPGRKTFRCDVADCLEYGVAWIISNTKRLHGPLYWKPPKPRRAESRPLRRTLFEEYAYDNRNRSFR